MAHITSIHPRRAVEGGRITIHGQGFATGGAELPAVHVGDARARTVFASPSELGVVVPASVAGRAAVRVEGAPGETAFVDVAAPLASGLHQVDNPLFDHDGNLYVTYSGTRGQQVPVSIYRVRPDGTREPYCSGVVNPTSLAMGLDGRIYVSSRFEGTIYRVSDDGSYAPFATDLGVACGLAFDADGTLYVGDRSGTVFRVGPDGHASPLATLPASVAAFHLALGRDALYVTAPTLSPYDPVYRVGLDGAVSTVDSVSFGRPQGLAFDRRGDLHVVEALAGVSGVYRIPRDGAPELVVAGAGLVGVAFDAQNGMAVCSNDTAYYLTPLGS